MRRAFILATAAALCGCSKDAKLSDLVPAGATNASMDVWLTLTFKQYPPNIDRRDVQVTFSSVALEQDSTYDWNYIATRDVLPPSVRSGNPQNTDTSPEGEPSLTSPSKVSFTLPFRKHFVNDKGEKLRLTATLYWGGVKQDSTSKSIGHLYSSR
jgi:hypothetical protein